MGNGVGSGLIQHGRGGRGHLIRIFLQQQTKAQVRLVSLKDRLSVLILGILAQGAEGFHGQGTGGDPFPVAGLHLINAGDLLIHGTGADQAHDPGNFHGVMVGTVLLIRNGEQGEGGGSRLGLPHGFNGGHLGLLGFRHGVAGLIPQHDHRAGGGKAEGGSNAEAAQGKFHMLATQEIETGNAQHEHGGGHIPGGHRVHELGLGRGIEHHRPEIREFHAHGHRIELGTHRVLHPGIGDEDQHGGKIGAQGHEGGDRQMASLGEPVPAEEEQAHHGGFQEKGGQAFNGQGGAENIPHVMGVIGPVGAELEFHGDARGDPQGEIDAVELAPEFGHVPVNGLAAYHIGNFHNHQQPGQPQGQGHEKKVIERCCRELSPRQINHVWINHEEPPLQSLVLKAKHLRPPDGVPVRCYPPSGVGGRSGSTRGGPEGPS